MVSDFLPMLGFKVDVRSLAKAEAEVEQNWPSGIIVCKNDVVGLHILVHQSGFVTLTQDCEQFPCRGDRFVKLNPLPLLTPLAQRWALDEIGHDIGLDLNLLPPMGIAFDQARNAPCLNRAVRIGLSGCFEGTNGPTRAWKTTPRQAARLYVAGGRAKRLVPGLRCGHQWVPRRAALKWCPRGHAPMVA